MPAHDIAALSQSLFYCNIRIGGENILRRRPRLTRAGAEYAARYKHEYAWVVTDEQRIRQRMIYVRHYFPGVNLDTISDEEFAMLSEEALWLHEQMLISRMPVPMSLPERTP